MPECDASERNAILAEEPETVGSIARSHYGEMQKGTILLSPEEALYLMDIRNAKCLDREGNEMRFNDVAALFPQEKQMARLGGKNK